ERLSSSQSFDEDIIYEIMQYFSQSELNSIDNDELHNKIEQLFNSRFPYLTAAQKSSLLNKLIDANQYVDLHEGFYASLSIYNNIDFYIKTTTFDSLISVFEAGREADDSTW
ncbi:type III secretion system protein MxiM, partial [Shigella flexneri]|nr:Mxi-Spa secretion machinery protein MxiL [Shigella sonnei]EFY1805847.1 Mxi-Spa secretion machinery protein MxiL [Shigella flexneri]EFZ7379801.1 Mxi-Spa secretion machinery protein MxiL [Shigella sonnei]EGW4473129.1 Mxi-Spa secretion machinery protein MxiL [Shigella flexneri]EHW8474171.1 type III secretion system protein MxiM [Shigella flexneri]